jgi:hypothetical protein
MNIHIANSGISKTIPSIRTDGISFVDFDCAKNGVDLRDTIGTSAWGCTANFEADGNMTLSTEDLKISDNGGRNRCGIKYDATLNKSTNT